MWYLRPVAVPPPTPQNAPFDADTFRALCAALHGPATGGESRIALGGPLDEVPRPLSAAPEAGLDLRSLPESKREQLRASGQAALDRRAVAHLVMNGGMATRFGGGAKGVVPLWEGSEASFLSTKLAQIAGSGAAAVLMQSFATESATHKALERLDWAGLEPQRRMAFLQSVMGRVDAAGIPLFESHPDWPPEVLFAPPGHGDTLGRLVDSGTLAALRRAGVEHLLVSNVDNLGATLDPVVVGAHLESVQAGHPISVEVVQRQGDAGGCIAVTVDGPVIVEGFRLPEGVDLNDYPEFNTNTLWFSLDHLERASEAGLELTWFAVQKTAQTPDGPLAVTQFEQLIGQVTERIPARYLTVDREERFVPVKTRDDLQRMEAQLRAIVAAAGG